jgi:nicotinamide-nucleotide amidase
MMKRILNEAENLLSLFRINGWRLVTAESCTGGGVAEALTAIPGSSDVFWGGYVTYADSAKSDILGVSPETLKSFGAVSAETVQEMVQGALRISRADFAVAVSGIAGPGGGSPEKPVGTVFIAVGRKNGELFCEKFLFAGNRQEIRKRTVFSAFDMLNRYISGIGED